MHLALLLNLAFASTHSLTGISYSFHLIDVIIVYDVIKSCVELVEEVHHLVRCAGAGELGKANNVTGKKARTK